jgi:hypothetical protein
MADITYYLTNDWFKIGRSREKQVKQVNQAIFGINKN